MLLAYLLALSVPPASPEAGTAGQGLRGTPLEWVSSGNVSCAFSAAGEDLIHATAQRLRECALEFHRIVQAESAERTVLPFRFPTFFPDADAILNFLEQHSRSYAAELRRLDGSVQMELHLRRPTEKTFSSGAEFLLSRQQWVNHVKQLRQRVLSLPGVREERSASLSYEERIYVLISRAALKEFQESLAAWQDSRMRLSGPWPPLAFVRYQPHAGIEAGTR